MGIACDAAGGDLLDGGVDGVEEGFGFGASGHFVGWVGRGMWLWGHVIRCRYGMWW